MKAILICAVLIFSSYAIFTPVDSDIVEAIKLKAVTWTPYEIHENPLAGKSNMDLMHMFRSYGMSIDSSKLVEYSDYSDIPDSFNATDKFGDCIVPIQNQELCGADWAMVAVQILSERFCIVTNGTQRSLLSVNHLLSCDFNDWACSGGYPDKAWDFMAEDGIVTEECNPFDAKDGHKPQCLYDRCVEGSKASNKKYYSSSFNMFTGVQNIQKEIMTNGPVQTEFYVYSDFLNYKNGIYRHISGPRLGFYSAKIVGWGVDQTSNTPYWLAASVFGKDWGENGYFRIARGNNECNFENNAVAGTPDTFRL